MKNLVLMLLCLSLALNLYSQSEKLDQLSSKEIDRKRYEDIDGDPYLMKDFRMGKLVSSESSIVDSVLLNYNGYSGLWEVKQDGIHRELEKSHYPLVVIYGNKGQEVFFKRNNYRQLFGKYSRIVYKGDNLIAYENLTVEKDVTIPNYGGAVDIVKFKRKKAYFMVKDEELHSMRLNKKSVSKILGENDSLKKFLKQKKLTLNSEKSLIKVLEHFDTKM